MERGRERERAGDGDRKQGSQGGREREGERKHKRIDLRKYN